MTATGECVACLVRLGLGEIDEEVPSRPFGDYEIIRQDDGSFWELGRGAMGVTYCAKDRVLERKVALKVIEAPVMTSAGQKVRGRFLREARLAAAIRHPNVAGVFQYGASSTGDYCYYAMELVDGETLETRVRRDGPLKVEAALELAVQVTRALIAAASHGLVHRDLKPGNIMLTRGAEMEVKVIDFGLAKAITENENEMDLTHGAFLGTPAFASPEQFSGARADARSDIYSLGVTLWYALTGEVPYEGKTIEEIRRGHTELALPVEKLAAWRFPHPVIELLRRILAADPAERPVSARELMKAIEACRSRLGHSAPNERRVWWPRRKLLGLAALLALCGVAFIAYLHSSHNPASPELAPQKSIAILPFQDLSRNKPNTYFADGVQDEILTTLAKVADLRVISRTSVMQFRDSKTRNRRDIAQQLGVAYVLEGSVQRTENRIRVIAQLIDARSDARIWTEQYDGELSDILGQIAQNVARQLKVALSPDERVALQARVRRDPEAYELYLRARDLRRDGGAGGVMGRNALAEVALLDEAVARDPAFVSAFCLLVQAHLQAYSFSEDHTPERLALATKALETATRLEPDSGEVHLAHALFHLLGSRAYTPALAELALAASALPNDATIYYYIASIQRRQGHWDESIRTMERALVLDPRNGQFALSLSWTYRRLRRYDEAKRVVDNFLAWQKDDLGFQLLRTEIQFEEKADLTPMQEFLSRHLPPTADRDLVLTYRLVVTYFERDYRAVEKVISEQGPWDKTHGFNTPREYMEGFCARALGEPDRATAAFLRARERAAAPVATNPDDAKALMVLARIDAKLGRKEQAVEEAERAVTLLPISVDTYDGPQLLIRLGQVYTEVGDIDRAVEVLQRVAALPAGLAYGILQLDAEFDPLRGDSRFQGIIASIAPKQSR
jgi:serine/threonine protein kinase/Tfp pilus assembly protein PilF